ncbi:MAG: hypothetical protein K8W52_16085 [Deltaproteobacteria bacterium]|nr:hypothetical protein [Deltaproteobacteria bacterium]
MIKSLAVALFMVVISSAAHADDVGGPSSRPSAIEPSEAAHLAFRVPSALRATPAVTASAEDPAIDTIDTGGTDGEGWSLFHPRPHDQLRPLSIDESPITLDVGHVQGEFDVAVIGVQRSGSTRSVATSVMSSRIKLGLTSRVEAQLVIAPYARTRTDTPDATSLDAGYAGTTGRLKVNLWGNDGGRTAVAAVPYIRVDGDGIGVGVGAPIAVDLGRGFGLTVVPQLDQAPEGLSGSTTVTVGHTVIGPLSAQLESSVIADVADVAAVGVQANSGLSVLLGDDAELDAGARLGVVGDLPDLEVFLRLSARR